MITKQTTIKKKVGYSGIGIHSGKIVHMVFQPAPEGFGRQFCRKDLPGFPLVPALSNCVIQTERSTTIGKDGVEVQTVEHVLAALSAMGVDNVLIELDNSEPPVANGSSDVFVEMLKEAGLEEQSLEAKTYKVTEPLKWSEGDASIEAYPFEGFKVSYHLSYPFPEILRYQFFEGVITPNFFEKEMAPCRTFALYQELEFLIDAGLIRGGSLSNAVVILGDVILSRGGLFFSNEMARHKALDFVGDASLSGVRLEGHFILRRSGHRLNTICAEGIRSCVDAQVMQLN